MLRPAASTAFACGSASLGLVGLIANSLAPNLSSRPRVALTMSLSPVTLLPMRRLSHFVAFTTVFLATTVWAQAARADLRSAEDKLTHGDYAGALKDFRAVKGKDAA